MAVSMASGRISSSRLTSMRMAWKVRLAGWPPRRRAGAGMASRTMAASSAVVSIGPVGHDGGGDADGEALVAVLLEHPDELDLGVAVDDVGRGPLRRRGPCACRAGPSWR